MSWKINRMVKVIVAKITFPAVRDREEIILRKPSEVRIRSSFKYLTDTATITMARRVKLFDKQRVREVFRAGDPVKIELGYNYDYITEFEGYIARVSDHIPIIIECEDEMWKLKQLPVHISKETVMLDSFLKEIAPGYEVDADTIAIGSVRFVNSTVAQVLDEIKSKFGLYSYMKGKMLVTGKYYADDTDEPYVPVHLERDVATNNLSFRHANDLRVQIKAISTLSSGQKLDVTVGDEGGEVRQLTYFNIGDTATLKRLAEEDLQKYRVDRFDGSIAMFGRPYVRHGLKVALESGIYPERNGRYYVEATDVGVFANAQYRRIVTLGDVVSI
ncbi:MAG: hypothetical protein CVU03_05020 [Bacteroidetes bacterium HGW-Bacteroidetes-2]|nr:MAG: hypothetical protein CVU03_05020 [Bacteroidetes bacterium HGW-Bacteroidetes-2]